jgi:hypothetical protein
MTQPGFFIREHDGDGDGGAIILPATPHYRFFALIRYRNPLFCVLLAFRSGL